jgi:hypothetical protein
MAIVTLHQIVDAVETTLGAAASLSRSSTFDELTEGIHDCPQMQVYPASNQSVDRGQETDRSAFIAATTGTVKHRQKEYVIHADVYIDERANIAEGIARMVVAIDQIETILEAEVCPLFGLTVAGAVKGPIRSFRWSWEYVIFVYGGIEYVGVRFILTLVVF